VESPIAIELYNSYNDTTRQGTITAKIKNTGTTTDSSAVSGKLYFALTETGIFFTAPNGVGMHNQTMLDIFPNANGVAISLPSKDSTEQTQTYTIKDSFPLNPPQNTKYHKIPPESCQVVVFVQNPSSKEVLQAAKLWVTSTQGMNIDYDKTTQIGGDDKLSPGETGNMVLVIKNSGDKQLTGVQGTLTATDSYITISDPTGNFGDIGPNQSKDNQSDPFIVQAAPSTPNGHTVDFTLKVQTANHYSAEIPFSLTVTGIGEVSRPAPHKLFLGSARPNPMHDWTVIDYALPTATKVSLKIYSATGELVKTLVAKTQPAGTQQIRWDGTDAQGNPVASGVYFSELVANGTKATERITKKFMKVR
jgi:hypothetical protein